MRINNNVMALNTHRQYTINVASVAKSMEKLSSGYRVNRAGDDAAGLAISEKMRAQIRGLRMASKNSSDAISLVQTAEGALQETHNILQRMRELAVQSASDTNETSIDRAALNAEFQQLKNEVADTAKKTKFNDMGVIDGSYSGSVTEPAPPASKISYINGGFLTPGTMLLDTGKYMLEADDNGGAGPFTFKMSYSVDGVAGSYKEVSRLVLTDDQIALLDLDRGDEIRLQLNDGTAIRFTLPPTGTAPSGGPVLKTAADLLNAITGSGDANLASIGVALVIDWVGKPITIQTGANQGDELRVNIAAMDDVILGTDTLSIATGREARHALSRVNDAVNFVSTQRATLGALQNRLNHKINNLDTSAENLAAAESRIRDLDMAQEMTTFTRNNILVQASTAMLAQANAAPQSILSLLQG